MSTLVSAIVTAAITALGTMIYRWWAAKKAADTAKRADALTAQAKADAEASATEAALLDAKEKAEHEKPVDPADWR